MGRLNNFFGICCLHVSQVITSYLLRTINPRATKHTAPKVINRPRVVDTLQTTINSKSKYNVTEKATILINNKNKSIY